MNGLHTGKRAPHEFGPDGSDAVVCDPASARSATWALARVHMRALIVHPAVLATVATMSWLALLQVMVDPAPYAILFVVDRATQQTVLPLAGGLLLATNLVALRPIRHGTAAEHGLLTLAPWRRTVALLLGTTPAVALAAVVVGVQIALVASQPGTVGTPSLVELAAGPAIVAVAGAVGVALASAIRSAVAAPLLLVAGVTLWVAAALGLMSEQLARVVPLAPSLSEMMAVPGPEALLDRRSAGRLIYLVGLLLVAVAWALWRQAAPARLLTVITITASALTTAGLIATSAPSSPDLDEARLTATLRPAQVQTCDTRGSVTVCAFPSYTPRIDGWHRVVADVRRRVPAAIARSPLTVRQGMFDVRAFAKSEPAAHVVRQLLEPWTRRDASGAARVIPVGPQWGDIGSGADYNALELATRVAVQAVNRGPAPASAVDEDGFQQVCGAPAVVALWLAGQVGSDAETALAEAGSTAEQDGITIGMVGPPETDIALSTSGLYPQLTARPEDAQLALALLDQPDDQVAAALGRDWQRLTSPVTDTRDIARLFGVTPPQQAQPCS